LRRSTADWHGHVRRHRRAGASEGSALTFAQLNDSRSTALLIDFDRPLDQSACPHELDDVPHPHPGHRIVVSDTHSVPCDARQCHSGAVGGAAVCLRRARQGARCGRAGGHGRIRGEEVPAPAQCVAQAAVSNQRQHAGRRYCGLCAPGVRVDGAGGLGDRVQTPVCRDAQAREGGRAAVAVRQILRKDEGAWEG